MNRKRASGFTLIELLIVIAIIGILASIILVGLGSVQRQARDARRIAEIRQVQNALELYFAKCHYYPGNVWSATPPCGPIQPTTDWATLRNVLTGSNLGVNQLPDDPSGGTRHYAYGTNAVNTSYTLGAALEDTSNSALLNDVDDPSAGVTVNGVECGDPTNDIIYCVTF